jgi:hypothetical protein
MFQRLTFAALLLVPAVPVPAHHSLAAEFDGSKPVVLNGKITKVDWMNPHVYVWVDAIEPGGRVTNWKVEGAAPNYLQRLGWAKGSVKIGDMVTIHGYMAKDQPGFSQSRLAKMEVVSLPDGRHWSVGHADDRPR